MKVDIFNQKGKKVSEVEIKEFTKENAVNDAVLAQYVYIYLSNQRGGNADTKDRSEVRGGGKKPWAQKGTGNARAGSIRSPIWKGGGITFGPTNEVNWKKKTTRSFRKSAFKNAFAKVMSADLLKIVEDLKIEDKSMTKQALEILNNFKIEKKAIVVTAEKNEKINQAFANLKNSKVVSVNKLNPYDLLTGGTILVESKALDYINTNWGAK